MSDKEVAVKVVSSVKPNPTEGIKPPFPVFSKDLNELPLVTLNKAYDLFNRTVVAMQEYGAEGWYNGTVQSGHCVVGHMYTSRGHSSTHYVDDILKDVGLSKKDVFFFNDARSTVFTEVIGMVKFWRDSCMEAIKIQNKLLAEQLKANQHDR